MFNDGVVFFVLRRYIFSSPTFNTRPQSPASSAPSPEPIVVNPDAHALRPSVDVCDTVQPAPQYPTPTFTHPTPAVGTYSPPEHVILQSDAES